MNYTVIGSALYGNKGAAAMLESLVQGIGTLDENSHFVLFSLYPIQDKERNPFPNLTIIPATPLRLVFFLIPLCLVYRFLRPLRVFLSRRSKAIRALTQSNVYVDQSGISFTDSRPLFIAFNTAILLPGLLVGCPVVKCAQALGPFHTRINQLSAGLVLPRLQAIFARGDITYSHLQTLGLTNISESTDLAFAFKADHLAPGRERPPGFPSATSMKTVGVSPSIVAARRSESCGIDYIKVIAQLIDELSTLGYQIVLFPHSARPDTERKHNNDIPLCQSIHGELERPEACRLINQEFTAFELRSLIELCNWVVTSRFHAMIGALAERVPCLVIGWSHKYSEVLSRFSLEELAIDYKECEITQLLSRFQSLVNQSSRIESTIESRLPAIQELAFRQVSEIHEIASKHSNSIPQ